VATLGCPANPPSDKTDEWKDRILMPCRDRRNHTRSVHFRLFADAKRKLYCGSEGKSTFGADLSAHGHQFRLRLVDFVEDLLYGEGELGTASRDVFDPYFAAVELDQLA
jgi:hypothetical protein